MKYRSFKALMQQNPAAVAKGPIALIFAEDDIEIDTTIRHHLNCGFKSVLVFMPDSFELPEDVATRIHRIPFEITSQNMVFDAINQVIESAPGIWMYYCYNAEYLFYPFCENRSVGEMLTFHGEERRDAMLTYVIDLYAADLYTHHNAVSIETAQLDRSGYYALARSDALNDNHPKERQLDFFGGLRWRYEEHIPKTSRKIDRISIFKSKPNLRLLPDHRFSDEEYNTYSCPWHHNLTAAICSFRTAKALKRNPGSSFEIRTFRWHNSTSFEWHSRQLLDLGLMEPGQWF